MNHPRLESTIEPGAAAETTWDTLIVGAGLAGAIAARDLARAGVATLLVDRADFPRWKVCGCCLSAHAQRTLAEAGLDGLLGRLGARRIDRVGIHSDARTLVAPLAPTRVVSRDALDAALVRAAIDAGAHFLSRTRARVHPDARIALTHDEATFEAHARTVILASGLHEAAPHMATRRRMAASRVSHVGLGATGDRTAAPGLPAYLTMALSRHGYVGFVHLEDGRLNAAAALAPAILKSAGSPAEAIAGVLAEAGLTGVDPHRLQWRGTPPLTRARSRVQHGAVFAVGDAARFVEPVTGEGMSWALAAGRQVVPHVAEHLQNDASPETWPAAHRRLLRARHVRCTLVSRAMRRPMVVSAFMRAMNAFPIVRERALRALVGAMPDVPEPAE